MSNEAMMQLPRDKMSPLPDVERTRRFELTH